MATLEKYLAKLREQKLRHAIESVTAPKLGERSAGEAYMYVVGFQSGMDICEKLLNEVLTEEKKGDKE